MASSHLFDVVHTWRYGGRLIQHYHDQPEYADKIAQSSKNRVSIVAKHSFFVPKWAFGVDADQTSHLNLAERGVYLRVRAWQIHRTACLEMIISDWMMSYMKRLDHWIFKESQVIDWIESMHH